MKCPNCKQEMVQAWKWKKRDWLCPWCGYEKKEKSTNGRSTNRGKGRQ